MSKLPHGFNSLFEMQVEADSWDTRAAKLDGFNSLFEMRGVVHNSGVREEARQEFQFSI